MYGKQSSNNRTPYYRLGTSSQNEEQQDDVDCVEEDVHGMVTARGNPKGIKGVEDLARGDVSIVNREPGAGSRRLLDARLERLGIAPAKVRGYQNEAPGHLPAALQVLRGAADCCIATRAAARMFGLGFIPLASERYDLVIRRPHLDLPGVQAMLDTLSRSAFRRELETLGGYDTRPAGRRVL